MSLQLSVATLLVRINRVLPKGKERHPAPVSKRLRLLCDVTTEQVDGCDVITLIPKIGGTAIEVIYTHGGSYIHPIVAFHWDLVWSIIQRTGATFTLPLYRLAPDGRMPDAYAMLEKVYASVLERAGKNHPVYLAGDSAGGGLALGQGIRYRDKGGRQPSGIILFSPWIELSMTNPAIREHERRDPMLRTAAQLAAARQWNDDLADPLASPLNDSLDWLPPLSIYQGGAEILLPDVEALVAKARAAGTKVHYWLSPKAFHDFVALGWIPESKAALDDLATQLNQAG
ncbi:MAG TPA: alpha/beta hydrolase [Galbitalea sp.]|jgi:acetyl esterase/lipase|nr:alpha/beta hydrolase [Galbitalea sp.]